MSALGRGGCGYSVLWGAGVPARALAGGEACGVPAGGSACGGGTTEGASRIRRVEFFRYWDGIFVMSSVKCTVPWLSSHR